jgi:hypothetical protein
VRPDGGVETAEAWAAVCTGSNLYRASLHGAVVPEESFSNSVGDTYRTLGVEAARALMIAEVRGAMGKDAPNLRHLCLIADALTTTGAVTSLEAKGMATREHGNVLLRMANSNPGSVVIDAALSGASAPVAGLAPALLLGATPKIGTNYNGIAIDPEFVRKNLRTVEDALEEI